jgi:hypothetical protein
MSKRVKTSHKNPKLVLDELVDNDLENEDIEDKENNVPNYDPTIIIIYNEDEFKIEMKKSTFTFGLLLSKFEEHLFKKVSSLSNDFKLTLQYFNNYFSFRHPDYNNDLDTDDLKKIISTATIDTKIDLIDAFHRKTLFKRPIYLKTNASSKTKGYCFIESNQTEPFYMIVYIDWLANRKNNEFFLSAPINFDYSTSKFLLLCERFIPYFFFENLVSEMSKVFCDKNAFKLNNETSDGRFCSVINVTKKHVRTIDSTVCHLKQFNDYKDFDRSVDFLNLLPNGSYRNFAIHDIVKGDWANEFQYLNQTTRDQESNSKNIAKLQKRLKLINAFKENKSDYLNELSSKGIDVKEHIVAYILNENSMRSIMKSVKIKDKEDMLNVDENQFNLLLQEYEKILLNRIESLESDNLVLNDFFKNQIWVLKCNMYQTKVTNDDIPTCFIKEMWNTGYTYGSHNKINDTNNEQLDSLLE